MQYKLLPPCIVCGAGTASTIQVCHSCQVRRAYQERRAEVKASGARCTENDLLASLPCIVGVGVYCLCRFTGGAGGVWR